MTRDTELLVHMCLHLSMLALNDGLMDTRMEGSYWSDFIMLEDQSETFYEIGINLGDTG